jgi:hypothetical protein
MARVPYRPIRTWLTRFRRHPTCTWLGQPYAVRVVEVLLLAHEERPFEARAAQLLSLAREAAQLSSAPEAEPPSLVGPTTEESGTAPEGGIGMAAGGHTA